jgi:SAM-dependent MidA family methyltransferase
MRVEPLRSELAAPPSNDPGEPRLVELIRAEIEERGAITFARFMEHALYEPGLGYYATNNERTTRAGDFVTAPELHPIFGKVVARQVDEMWQRLGAPSGFTVREYGAGRGTLGRALRTQVTYQPVEFDQPRPATPFTGVVLANEFLDALAVHRVVQRADGLRELCVVWSDGRFQSVESELSDVRLPAWFDRRGITLQAGQIAEVNLGMLDWLAEIGHDLERGYALILDYGAGAAELYGPGRRTGTLRAFRGHHVSSDIFGAVGHQDLTAHVDLDALEDGARDVGFELLGRVRQAEFLLGAGIEAEYAAEREQADADWDTALNLRAAIRRLLDPSGLGGFAVVILGKNVESEPPLQGLAKRAL